MADAKQCDRCGKYYTMFGDEEWGMHPEYDGMRVFGVKLFGFSETIVKSFDLCPICSNKILSFLQHNEDEDEHIIFANGKKFIKTGGENGTFELKEVNEE